MTPPPPAEQLAARIFVGPALRAQPDRRLVDLVRTGYDAAFEEIVRRYRRPLDRFAAAIVGGRSEDVTQDAFSKALLALRGSEAEIELRPWLYRIVRNTALNDLRDRAPAAEELSEALPGGRGVAAEAEEREELRDLMERLRALPEPQRAALVMRELEGLSHEEIAAALGVSGGAARQAIYRARAALREGLGLLLPLPALRMLTEHGAEMVKAGAATVLVAGAVGAGVAVEERERGNRGPEAAQAAPLVRGAGEDRGHIGQSESSPLSPASASSGGGGEDGGGHGPGRNSGPSDRSGPSGSSGHIEDSDSRGEGSGDEPETEPEIETEVEDSDDHGGAGRDSGSRAGSGSSSGSGGGHSGSGNGLVDEDSSGSDSDDLVEDSSGPGSGEVEFEEEVEPAPVESTDSNSGSGSSGDSDDYLAPSQSEPTPTSTSSSGSSG